MKTQRCLIWIGFCLGLASCSPAGSSMSAKNAPDRPKSKTCDLSGNQWAQTGGDNLPFTMRMKNDGGWCEKDSPTTANLLSRVSHMHVVQPPAHGTVEITVDDNAIRTGYKPDAGFVGTDRFRIMYELYNIDRQFNVTVSE